ncbi:hypothetical protein FPV67DRAFT_1457003 [Lyophyllum atratum]|nr:hypothetical protein FPV67DRAFT_1457003 [Lyophyllum atratum]
MSFAQPPVDFRQVAPARIVTGRSIDESRVGQKAYDSMMAMILVMDGDQGVRVDVSLYIDPDAGVQVYRDLGLNVAVMGNVEMSPDPLLIPAVRPGWKMPSVDPKLVVRALLVDPRHSLDLGLWNAAVEEREKEEAEAHAAKNKRRRLEY